ncbi:MAG: hypothetical protein IT581_23020 [Verrucomicrobiales bacterium]|nr:hypothetical protein [Verrucomicrobiales bacterium]
MELRYDEDFVEAAAFVCANGRRPGVSPLQIARFHRERERLYAILDPDARNTAFFRLHLEWFREWGLESLLTSLAKEFPLLPQKLAVLAVRKTRGKNDEGAELYVNQAQQRSAIIALPPESFERDATLRNYLRHEFTHLSDMVDPNFDYRPSLDLPGLNPAQQRLARERYRLLWDITIDGRLAAAGRTPLATREHHEAGFARGYSFWQEDRRTSTFDALWRNPAPRHAEFLALILDPRGLRDTQGPAPGASCPLCDFPTFAWAPQSSVTPALSKIIAADSPGWTIDQGLCGRCLETFQAMAGPHLSLQSVDARGTV